MSPRRRIPSLLILKSRLFFMPTIDCSGGQVIEPD